MTAPRIILYPVQPDPHMWKNLEYLNEGYDTAVWGKETFTDFLGHIRDHYDGYAIASVHMVDEQGRRSMPVGLYGFLPFPEEEEGAAETLVYLHPEARRLKVGTLLLSASAYAANEVPIALYSDVRTTNDTSVALHTSAFPDLPRTGPYPSPFGYETFRWRISDAMIPRPLGANIHVLSSLNLMLAYRAAWYS